MKVQLDITVENREEARQALYNAADNIMAGESSGNVYISGIQVGLFDVLEPAEATA
jgi:hypothetical protein